LTFIRKDFLNEKMRNTENLPTSLDMRNVKGKDDYTLSGFLYNIG